MSIIRIKIIFIYFLNILIQSCATQTKNMLGNVYISEKGNYIKGFRIEELKQDTIYVRYSIDKELFFPVSMISKKNNKYESEKPIPVFLDQKSKIDLKILNRKVIYIYLTDVENNKKVFKYIFLRRDKIIENNIKNIYYSEDGFNLK